MPIRHIYPGISTPTYVRRHIYADISTVAYLRRHIYAGISTPTYLRRHIYAGISTPTYLRQFERIGAEKDHIRTRTVLARCFSFSYKHRKLLITRINQSPTPGLWASGISVETWVVASALCDWLAVPLGESPVASCMVIDTSWLSMSRLVRGPRGEVWRCCSGRGGCGSRELCEVLMTGCSEALRKQRCPDQMLHQKRF